MNKEKMTSGTQLSATIGYHCYQRADVMSGPVYKIRTRRDQPTCFLLQSHLLCRRPQKKTTLMLLAPCSPNVDWGCWGLSMLVRLRFPKRNAARGSGTNGGRLARCPLNP